MGRDAYDVYNAPFRVCWAGARSDHSILFRCAMARVPGERFLLEAPKVLRGARSVAPERRSAGATNRAGATRGSGGSLPSRSEAGSRMILWSGLWIDPEQPAKSHIARIASGIQRARDCAASQS